MTRRRWELHARFRLRLTWIQAPSNNHNRTFGRLIPRVKVGCARPSSESGTNCPVLSCTDVAEVEKQPRRKCDRESSGQSMTGKNVFLACVEGNID